MITLFVGDGEETVAIKGLGKHENEESKYGSKKGVGWKWRGKNQKRRRQRKKGNKYGRKNAKKDRRETRGE